MSHSFVRDGVRLAYADEGPREGRPVLLVHGFASNMEVNWAGTSWVATLEGSGRRVVRLDNRGHGGSHAPHEREAYATATMAADALGLLDHLEIERAALFGYSMGARIAAVAALAAPERVPALVLSGMASALVEGMGGTDTVADALLAPSADTVSDPAARAYRVFAERTGSDREALAACIRAAREPVSADEVGRLAMPTLVVAGENDAVSGSADGLARLIPRAEAVTLAGRDHMSAVGDREHKRRVLAFLDAAGW